MSSTPLLVGRPWLVESMAQMGRQSPILSDSPERLTPRAIQSLRRNDDRDLAIRARGDSVEAIGWEALIECTRPR